MAQHDLGIISEPRPPALLMSVTISAFARQLMPWKQFRQGGPGGSGKDPHLIQPPTVIVQAQCALVLRAVIYKPLLCVSQPDFFLSFKLFMLYWRIAN